MKLVELFETNKASKKQITDLIKLFLTTNTIISKNSPHYYYKRCGIISVKFAEFLNTHHVSCKLLVGRNIDNTHVQAWVDSDIQEIKNNIKKHKKFGHGAVVVGDVVYDLSSRQFNKHYIEIYPITEFRKRWKKVKIMSLDSFKDEIKDEIIDLNPKQYQKECVDVVTEELSK